MFSNVNRRWLPGTLILAFSALRASESWALSPSFRLHVTTPSCLQGRRKFQTLCKNQPRQMQGHILSRAWPHFSRTDRAAHPSHRSIYAGRECWKRISTRMLSSGGNPTTENPTVVPAEDPTTSQHEDFLDFSDDLKQQGLSALLFACQHLEPSWRRRLGSQFTDQSFFRLAVSMKEEVKVQKHTVYPPPNLIFNAFQLTPFDKVRVCKKKFVV